MLAPKKTTALPWGLQSETLKVSKKRTVFWVPRRDTKPKTHAKWKTYPDLADAHTFILDLITANMIKNQNIYGNKHHKPEAPNSLPTSKNIYQWSSRYKVLITLASDIQANMAVTALGGRTVEWLHSWMTNSIAFIVRLLGWNPTSMTSKLGKWLLSLEKWPDLFKPLPSFVKFHKNFDKIKWDWEKKRLNKLITMCGAF